MAFNFHLVLFISTENKGIQNVPAKRAFHGVEASRKPACHRNLAEILRIVRPTKRRPIFCRDLVQGGKFARELSKPEYSAVNLNAR